MRPLITPAAVVLGLVSVGGTACGSSGSTNASTTANKTAFCNANKTLDQASASVNTPTDFINVLKTHAQTLATLRKNVPTGKVGTEAKALLQAANTAVATNNPNSLLSPSLQSYGGYIDTYCGVDGNGNPLPSYFGAGKTTAICSVQNQISAGTESAQGPADLLTFLSAHQNLVTEFANDVPSLPSSIKPQAQELVTAVQQAIATKNANLIGTDAINSDAMNVSLYCGENQ